jgi:hypothetical protein
MSVEITPDNDEEFWDRLREGVYDVRCYECEGTGKVKVLDESRATSDQIADYNDILNEDDLYRREVAAEARYFGY